MKPRLLVVIGSLDVGGAERQLLQILPALVDEFEIAVHVLIREGALAPAFRERGVRVLCSRSVRLLSRCIVTRKLRLPFNLVSLLLTLRYWRPHIVHLVLPASHLLGTPLALMCGCSRIVMSRRNLNQYQARRPLPARIERFLHRYVSVVIGNAQIVASELMEEGVSSDRLAVIRNGVIISDAATSRSRTEVRAEFGIATDTTVAILVANIIPYKGHETVIRAIALLAPAEGRRLRVMLVGRDDGIAARLRVLATELGVANSLIWTGVRTDVADLLAASDMAISASFEEACSNAVLESMAAGLPVIATRVGGTPEIVIDQVSGMLIEPDDPGALAAALSRLVGDPEARMQLGAAGRERVKTEFSLAECVNRHRRLYSLLFMSTAGKIEPSEPFSSVPAILATYNRCLSSDSDSRGLARRLLLAAAKCGDLTAAEVLEKWPQLQAADIDEAMRTAAEAGHLEFVRLFHESGHAPRVLSEESEVLLRHMENEVLRAAPVYRPSEFWHVLGETSHRYLLWGGEENFKRNIGQSYFSFIPLSLNDPGVRRCWWLWLRYGLWRVFGYRLEDPVVTDHTWFGRIPYYQVFKVRPRIQQTIYCGLVATLQEYGCRSGAAAALEFLEEPLLGNPIRVYDPDGRLVSQDLVNSALEYSEISACLAMTEGTNRRRIAELGAGYGRLAHVFLAMTRCQYFIFDIPPALHLSQWYVSELFPGRRVFRWRPFPDFQAVQKEIENCDIGFFTANQLELFPEGYFDVFVSISALHEMRREQIAHFTALMGRLTRELLFLKHYRLYENPHDQLTISQADYVLPAGWHRYTEGVDRVNPRFFQTVAVPSVNPSVTPAAAGGAGIRTTLVPMWWSRRDRPTVTIMLSNYNDARFLPESLAGIFNQTLHPDEVVLIDDGSTDDSWRLLSECAAMHPQVVLLRNEHNRGLLYSINRALRCASGDYVVWASADDRLLPGFIERSIGQLKKYPGVGVCASRLGVFTDNAGEVREFTEANHGSAFDFGCSPSCFTAAALVERLRESYLWLSSNTIVARRDAVQEAGGFQARSRWHADWFSYYVVALRYGACTIPETLALMRERTATYSRTGMRKYRQQWRVLGNMMAIMRSAAFSDVRRAVRARPALLSPFGRLMLVVLLARPQDWDIFWRYLNWFMEYRYRAYGGTQTRPSDMSRRLKWYIYRWGSGLSGLLTPQRWSELSGARGAAGTTAAKGVS